MIKILVPLDGSLTAETAIAHAAAIARGFSAEIELFTVIGESKEDSSIRIDSVDWQLWKQQSKAYLTRIADRMRSTDLTVSWQLREGDAAHEIVHRISEANIDLLVLSRFGKGGAESFNAGGTAQKILSASVASVLLVNPQQPLGEHGYQRILVPVDGSQRADWACSFAAVLAQTHSGSLQLLRVVEEPSLPPGTPTTAETRRIMDHVMRIARSRANLQLHHTTANLSSEVDVASAIVVSDDVPSTIEAAAESNKSDLLVLSAQARQLSVPGRYGAICEALLSHVQAPILVLRDGTAAQSMSNFRSVFLDAPRDEPRADVV